MNHYEKQQKLNKVYYVCDRHKCEACVRSCRHTTDITHAAYTDHGAFDIASDGSLWERIRKHGKGVR